MAAKKQAAPEKKQAEPKEVWTYMEKGFDEAYGVFPSRLKVIEAIRKEIEHESRFDNYKTRTYQIFKLDSEVKFEVEVKEVPVMTKQRVVKEKK